MFNKTIKVNTDAASALTAASQAIEMCGWRITFKDSSTVRASIGVSLTSWGESFVVRVQSSSSPTFMSVQSQSEFALFDWGKNKKNVDAFLSKLSRIVVVE